MSAESENSMRLDKWLWVARFFKTRGLAQKHIELGRVQVNGAKVKNSKAIAVGDVIDLTLNSLPYKLTVLKLNQQRRPASEARLLYEENAQVMALREEQKMLKQMMNQSVTYPDGRPTKRDRRQLDKIKHANWQD